MYDMDKLMDELRRDEGVKSHPYVDTVGKTTIGVGHNLSDLGISDRIINALLEEDIAIAETGARSIYPDFDSLSDARQRVLVNMTFNLGRARLALFTGMLGAMRNGDWSKAADEMLDSRWAVQVGPRSQRLAAMMKEG